MKTLFIILLCQIAVVTSFCNGGTTSQIKELVKGKCLLYQTIIQPDVFCNSRRNCDEVADKFVEAFLYQPTCNVSVSRFNDYLNLTRHPVQTNKSIFWEDVYQAVALYANQGKRLVSIADTLYGYIADGLHFCAKLEDPGMIINETCAGFDATGDCEKNAEYSFWVGASEQFSSDVNGKVYIMLNASIENTFKEKSYFANNELPNLNGDRVSKAEIFLVKYAGHETRSTCNDDSIKLLKSTLKKNGIEASCIDNPRDVQIVLCSMYPEHPDCSLLSDAS
ncbi:hypothetical protein LOTGIDRAFT_150043 [Lottia gigantea]|uniref:Uncharacterized protein n=1 Tax=Lottia gigantea TaxID=225164 RepID=V4AMV5_LOTGI|nr:hypothetical protein LOTGIDRAFT_150043 [Lottia gigantea]ESO96105.1 hypothetical protein LOTGIDRAFT_150043 [Lottia gigantea]